MATAALARPEYFAFSHVSIFFFKNMSFYTILKVVKSCDLCVLFIKIDTAFQLSTVDRSVFNVCVSCF